MREVARTTIYEVNSTPKTFVLSVGDLVTRAEVFIPVSIKLAFSIIRSTGNVE